MTEKLLTGTLSLKANKQQLKLHNICWGSQSEHLAVGPTRSRRKITEIHGLEVDQSSSTIFSHIVARNILLSLMIISFLYFSSLMQAKNISSGTIG